MSEFLPGLSAAPNVHPLLVHFPIALWGAAALFGLVGWIRKDESLLQVARWTMTLGTVGALFAVISGYRAADQLGHDSPGHDLVHVHRNWMIAASLIALGATGFVWYARDKSRGVLAAAVLGLVIAFGIAALGADRGALLVFGYGMGTAGLEPPESDGHHHGAGAGHHGGTHDTRDPTHSDANNQGSEPDGVDSADQTGESSPKPTPAKHDHDHHDHEH